MTRKMDSEAKDSDEKKEPVFGLRPMYVSPFSERYESGEPKTDVWISDTEFQCDSCSHVQPDWLAARTPNGTLVCENCLSLGMNEGRTIRIAPRGKARRRRLEI
jgi:hypothetical protein